MYFPNEPLCRVSESSSCPPNGHPSYKVPESGTLFFMSLGLAAMFLAMALRLKVKMALRRRNG